ncbi:hypothetical protein FM113_13525 [Leucobacter sp. 7(1)]|uniref:hypothetical protein n=1 Tax=Leucobacter sp. 7(1) TaxID=1255613 RepID=UPI00097F46B2|nr:hypothetical protein [Leucobacter sp. 7(1)]SJN11965.1 hypothetical protein FM113_13525 [Leucobacter sp. 7(1)]
MAAQLDDLTVLARFVIRARRVEAHSLVQDEKTLLGYAKGTFKVTLGFDGAAIIRRPLPENEEEFESLVARIRPLTLKSEPIYYAKVLGALERVLEQCAPSAEVLTEYQALKVSWEATDLQGTQVQGYSVQRSRLDGSEATKHVSDTQFAAAWVYADLVHADAQGPKAEALAFDLVERYAAAVLVFCGAAVRVVRTLRLIEHLRAANLLDLADELWSQKVTVDATEIVEEAEVFMAPVGAPMPNLMSSVEMGEDWKSISVTEMLRLETANRVTVLLRDDDRTIETSDAAVIRREEDEESMTWEALIAESALCRLVFEAESGEIRSIRSMELQFLDHTHSLKLSAYEFKLKMFQAKTLTLQVGDQNWVTLRIPEASEEELLQQQVLFETTRDIVLIEQIANRRFTTSSEPFTNDDRMALRVARLTWEGKITLWNQGPIQVTTENGLPPSQIQIPAQTLSIGGVEIPTPEIRLRHPGMDITELQPESPLKAGVKLYELRPPGQAFFRVWAPEQVQVSSDADLASPVPWSLPGMQEAEPLETDAALVEPDQQEQ